MTRVDEMTVAELVEQTKNAWMPLKIERKNYIKLLVDCA